MEGSTGESEKLGRTAHTIPGGHCTHKGTLGAFRAGPTLSIPAMRHLPSSTATTLLSAQPWRGPAALGTPPTCAHAPSQGLQQGLSPPAWVLAHWAWAGELLQALCSEGKVLACLGSTSSAIPQGHTGTAWSGCAHEESPRAGLVAWVCPVSGHSAAHPHKAHG